MRCGNGPGSGVYLCTCGIFYSSPQSNLDYTEDHYCFSRPMSGTGEELVPEQTEKFFVENFLFAQEPSSGADKKCKVTIDSESGWDDYSGS